MRRIPFAGDGLSRAGAVLLIALLGCGLLGIATGIFGQPAALVSPPLRPPSWAFPFGTDNLGRSVLARTVAGIQQSVLLATCAVLLATIIGTLLGMCAGYFRGAADELIARVADALFSFPAIVLAILISAMFRPGALSAIAAVVLVTLPTVIRVVRAETLTIAGRDFVTQSRIAGASGRACAQNSYPAEHNRSDHRPVGLFDLVRHDHRKRHKLPRARCSAAGCIAGIAAVRGTALSGGRAMAGARA